MQKDKQSGNSSSHPDRKSHPNWKQVQQVPDWRWQRWYSLHCHLQHLAEWKLDQSELLKKRSWKKFKHFQYSWRIPCWFCSKALFSSRSILGCLELNGWGGYERCWPCQHDNLFFTGHKDAKSQTNTSGMRAACMSTYHIPSIHTKWRCEASLSIVYEVHILKPWRLLNPLKKKNSWIYSNYLAFLSHRIQVERNESHQTYAAAHLRPEENSTKVTPGTISFPTLDPGSQRPKKKRRKHDEFWAIYVFCWFCWIIFRKNRRSLNNLWSQWVTMTIGSRNHIPRCSNMYTLEFIIGRPTMNVGKFAFWWCVPGTWN